MASFNIFKKKPKEVIIAKPKEKKDSGLAYRVLKSPHITEKATDLVELNQYTFEVWKNANKTEIKKAVEGLYNVDVISVRIVNIPRKERRFGKVSGWRKGYKKTIIKIAKGQKIEVLPR